MKLADARTIRAIDEASVKRYGITGLVLMENAGRGLADAIARELASTPGTLRRVSIVTGKGNNGGDGFVAARHLKNRGIDAVVFSLARLDELKGDPAVNAVAWKKMGGHVTEVLSTEELRASEKKLRHSSIVVDAIFGTGLSSEVRGLYREAIDIMNSIGRPVVAVDIPSGIDASTGALLGEAVKASLTVTMAMPKIGLYLYPGRSYAGRIEVVDIGAPRELIDDEAIAFNLTTDDDIKRILRPRRADSHKGLYGNLLILAGSPGLTGAAYMAGVASMRAGAGLVTIGLPESLNPVMEAKTTEVMTIPLPETKEGTLGAASFDRIRSAMGQRTALVIGPGLGSSKELSNLLEKILKDTDLPVLIDADGLNAFIGNIPALKGSRAQKVLTPHPGEMARLLGTSSSEVQADRIGSAGRLAKESGSVVVLKGAGTVIASPEGRVFINPTGNAGLATAGTGDVLAGMIGGLLAQGYGPFDAAVASVYMHGLAADILKEKNGEAGMMATDLLPLVPVMMNSLTVSSK